MKIAFDFMAGLVVGILLTFLSGVMLAIAWGFLKDVIGEGKNTHRAIQLIVVLAMTVIGSIAALILPVLFIEHNKGSPAVLFGGVVALVLGAAFVRRTLIRRPKKLASQTPEPTSTAVTAPAGQPSRQP